MNNPTLPIALILAAGHSRRFGGDKRLATLGDRTVLEAVCEALTLAGLEFMLALRADDPEPLTSMGPHVTVPASVAAGGMGNTLAMAVGRLPPERDVLICLGDMPWIAAATYRRIARSVIDTGAIVQPCYRAPLGQLLGGHPVGFPARFRSQLTQLHGDAGARTLLQRNAATVMKIEVDDPAILRDVDTPDDLA